MLSIIAEIKVIIKASGSKHCSTDYINEHLETPYDRGTKILRVIHGLNEFNVTGEYISAVCVIPSARKQVKASAARLVKNKNYALAEGEVEASKTGFTRFLSLK